MWTEVLAHLQSLKHHLVHIGEVQYVPDHLTAIVVHNYLQVQFAILSAYSG